jgi:hypothetical protein
VGCGEGCGEGCGVGCGEGCGVGCGVGCGAHGTGRQTEGDLRVRLTNQHIAALKEARKLIDSKDEYFICRALDYVGADPKLRLRIARLLGPEDSLYHWLLNHPSGIDKVLLTYRNMRLYRLRWIDHMIATREL